MSLEVGTAYARLGAHLDDAAFDRYDRRIREARTEGDRGATARLRAETDTRGFDKYDRSVRDVNRGHEDLVRGSGRVRTAMGSLYLGGAGVAGAGLAMGLLAKGASSAVDAFQNSEIVARRQALVIRTMGTDAGATAKHVAALASAMEKKTGIDDDTIISGANVLRTFQGIRNEAGKGNDVFDRTTKAAVDLSSALGIDLQQANIQLGKAMAEPARGAAALSRSGTVLKSDVEKLKEMAKSGVPVLEQQKFLLAAVEKQVKGTAASNSTATSRMKAQFGELQEAIGKVLAPAFDLVAGKLNHFIQGLISGKGAGGDFRDAVVGAFKTVRGVVTDVVDWVLGAIRTLTHDRSVQVFAATAIAFFKDLASAVGDVVRYVITQVKSVQPELTIIGHAIAKVATVILDVFRAVLPGVERALKGIVDIVKGVIQVLAGLLTLDFAKVWEGIKGIVGGALKAVEGIISGAASGIRTEYGAIFGGLAGIARAAWNGVTGIVKKGIDFLAGGASTVLGIIGDAARAASHIPFIGDQFKGVADKIDGARDSIDKFRESLRGTAKTEMPRASDAAIAYARRVGDLKDRLHTLKRGTDEYRSTAALLRRAQGNLNDELAAANGAGRKGAKGIATIAGGAFSASSAVADASANIATNVDQLARKLGAQGITFRPARTAAGRQNQDAAFGNPLSATNGLAGGGHIVGGDPRARGRDDRILLGPDGRPEARVGAGELLVFNGDQQTAIRNALAATYGVGLDQFFAGGWRPHYAQTYATGGRIANYNLVGPDGAYKRDGNAALDRIDQAAEARVAKAVKAHAARMARAGGGLGASGPAGLGTFDGIPVANWIIPELNWARRNGWGGHVTSGYRSHAHNVAQGRLYHSNHEDTRYPGGAIDVGGYGARAEGAALESVIEGYPGPRRLVWGGPIIDDWGHFSATGHAAGGRIPAFAGGGILAKAEGYGHRAHRAARKGSRGLGGWESRIAVAERTYGQDDRLYGLSDETIVVEDDNGAHIDNAAVKKRTAELTKLTHERQHILKLINDYRAAAKRSLGQYRIARARIKRALDAIPKVGGKTKSAKRSRAQAAKLRDGYRQNLSDYDQRIGDLSSTVTDLTGDARDSRIDLKELAIELGALDPAAALPGGSLDPTTGIYSKPNDDPSSSDPGAGDTSSADTGSSDTGSSDPAAVAPAAPTAEDIAAGVAQALTTFNQGRADLFSQFGSNFMGAGDLARVARGGATGMEDAAGLNYFGAGTPGGGSGVVQNINVTIADPADTHVFTQSALHELQAAI